MRHTNFSRPVCMAVMASAAACSAASTAASAVDLAGTGRRTSFSFCLPRRVLPKAMLPGRGGGTGAALQRGDRLKWFSRFPDRPNHFLHPPHW